LSSKRKRRVFINIVIDFMGKKEARKDERKKSIIVFIASTILRHKL
jgi:hypothetical protein